MQYTIELVRVCTLPVCMLSKKKRVQRQVLTIQRDHKVFHIDWRLQDGNVLESPLYRPCVASMFYDVKYE